MESTMSKAGLDNRRRNKDGEMSGKHGNTPVRMLRKIYGQGFTAGYLETAELSEVKCCNSMRRRQANSAATTRRAI
jgi:hypothetical protein